MAAKKANKVVVPVATTTVAKKAKRGRGRPARTTYQKVIIWIAKLFAERFQAVLLKRVV